MALRLAATPAHVFAIRLAKGRLEDLDPQLVNPKADRSLVVAHSHATPPSVATSDGRALLLGGAADIVHVVVLCALLQAVATFFSFRPLVVS